jgi:hypothetical protein
MGKRYRQTTLWKCAGAGYGANIKYNGRNHVALGNTPEEAIAGATKRAEKRRLRSKTDSEKLTP